MAYGMSAAKEAGLAQTQVWKRLMGMPVDQLKAAAKGDVPGVDMNLATLALRAKMTQVADKGAQAQQQLAAAQGSVKQRMLAQADQLPEMLGIGRLPAQNMDEMAAAQGGVVGYADGGEVAHFEEGGTTYGGALMDLIRRQFMPGEYLSEEEKERARRAYKNPLNVAEGKTFLETPINRPPLNAPAAPAPAAPAAAPAVEPVKAPQKVKDALANVSQPKVPVADPTREQKENVDDQMGYIDKLTSFLDKKFKGQLDPIKDQLAKDREDYKTMKSENVGLALLGAAGALLKPGRTTASAIGEGLSTLGEYGMRFQPQLLAARQGISSGEVGLAQAEAQAARGNFATAAQLANQREQAALEREKLAMQRPYYAAYASYLGSKGAGIGGGGDLSTVKAYQKSLQDDIKNMGVPTSAADKVRLGQLQSELRSVEELLRSRVKGLNIGDNAAPPPGSIAGSYQRP